MRTTLPDQVAARRAEVERVPLLHRLATRLRALAAPILDGEPYLPARKPMLSRDGGVCGHDGARLIFDPLAPDQHVCPACGEVHRGDRHHRAWIWRYHLWLSERAIHLGLLSGLLDEPMLAHRAARILERYAELYPTVPNVDNVLGPTRLFFSTYLESLWLTQVVIAGLILRNTTHRTLLANHDLDSMVAESAELIASFDEGMSNRQVWNLTALLASAEWLGDRARAEWSIGRLTKLLGKGVTPSGLWHEGENYHFFALRGFSLASELARWAGHELPPLQRLYEAPLDTLLPDLTLPARGDAPFGVSVAQPRFADLWELGRRRTGSARIDAVLAELYSLELPEGNDPGFADVAEQEVNRPPVRFARDRLSWKALLWMMPDAPQRATEWRGSSSVFVDAGVVVMRPAPDTYVSLECTGPRGGHGHPDALHLSAFLGRSLLADFGTGSYVSPSLHWYRSTLAHNAPTPAGRNQPGGVAWCAALDERDGWSWCQCEAEEVCGGATTIRRSVICSVDWVLDIVDVSAPEDAAIDVPIHPLVDGNEPALVPREGESVRFEEGPGPPTPWFADGPPFRFLVRRAYGSGRWIQAVFRDPGGRVLLKEDEIVVQSSDTTHVTVSPGSATLDGPGDRHVQLSGLRERRPPGRRPVAPPPPVITASLLDRAPALSVAFDRVGPEAIVVLESESYRRSEAPHGARGPFRAQAAWFAAGDRLGCVVRVVKSETTFRPVGTVDPQLDNESADIHSDGVQLYVGGSAWRGWVAVPAGAGTVRTRAVAGTAADGREIESCWEPTADGYLILASVLMPRALRVGDRIPVNLVVNEMYPDRERRAGQLALGGGGWVYLRGDRESPSSGAIAEIT